MELLKGDDLKKWTQKDNLLPVEKTLEYMAISAEALDYAHKNGVVHRDIKPANIMLLENGELRVADFGIARLQASSKTATGTVLGTPYYMSPEQISGKKVDGRADLFSLGVTLYELLTGERPWKGGEAVGTLFFQISSDPYPDPLLVRADLPKDILPVIDRALKKNPDDRYQTGAEMAAGIRAVLNKTAASGAGAAPAPVKAPAPKAAAPVKPVLQPAPATKPLPSAGDTVKQQAHPAVEKEPQVSRDIKAEPQRLTPAAAPQPPAAAQNQVTPNKIELEPPSATLSLSPQKAAQLKASAPALSPRSEPTEKDAIQRPAAEALGQPLTPLPQAQNQPAQPAIKQAPLVSGAPDFEKTLPLIYPDEETK
jgi:serine/threonine protein kinase